MWAWRRVSPKLLGYLGPMSIGMFSSPQLLLGFYNIWETSSLHETISAFLAMNLACFTSTKDVAPCSFAIRATMESAFCCARPFWPLSICWSEVLNWRSSKLRQSFTIWLVTFSTEATQGKQVKDFGGILLNSWLSIVPPKSNFQNPHVAVSLQPPPFLVSASLLYKFKSCHAFTMMTKGPAFGGETFIPSASSSWTS